MSKGEVEINIDNFLDGVETAANAPIALSRWGFKRIELNGKIYLLARTEEELLTDVAASENKDIETVKSEFSLRPWCYMDMAGICYKRDACNECEVRYAAGWFCNCKW